LKLSTKSQLIDRIVMVVIFIEYDHQRSKTTNQGKYH